MRIEPEIQLDFSDVLLRPKRSNLESRKDVKLKRVFNFKNSKQTWVGVPIISANMDSVSTSNVAKVLHQQSMLTCLPKRVSNNELLDIKNSIFNYKQTVVLSTGIKDKDFENIWSQIEILPDVQFVCIDVANGYTQAFVDAVKWYRKALPYKTLIAGNVVSKEMVETLILDCGVDIVKVGIGPGSACTTRKMTGVGVPQLSAVMECADAAHGVGGYIISDGGCVVPGDISKAFCAGADFVMLGGMLAGHKENSEIVYIDDKPFAEYYGMSSKKANDKHFGGLSNYKASEGRELLIPYKGYLMDTITEIEGSVRSTCTYIGSSSIKQMPKCATFVRVNNQLNNSLVHYEKR